MKFCLSGRHMKNNIASYIAANRIRQNAAQIGRKRRKHAYTPVAVQRDRRFGSGGGNGRVPDSRPVRMAEGVPPGWTDIG